jgi:hypothetical protein
MSLPLVSIISISPDRGQSPYFEFSGNIQIAGQIQSPRGIFATTSTRPYRMLFLPFVVRRADLTGGIMRPKVKFEAIAHDESCDPVQEPSPPAFVRFTLPPL